MSFLKKNTNYSESVVLLPKMDRQVLISGEGIGIGSLKIPMNEQKTSDIKNQILEERLSNVPFRNSEGKPAKDISTGTGWKLLRKNMKAKKLVVPDIKADERPTDIGTLLIPSRRSTAVKQR